MSLKEQSFTSEGITCLLWNARSNNNFHLFALNDNLHICLLQFANDIVILGQPSGDNIWTLKALLRGFELSSGLSVNFKKSKVVSFNVKPEFLKVFLNYLSRNLISSPFDFLGILISCNLRERSSWSPVIAKVRNMLSSWNGKPLSLGGRVTLINSVWISIHLFSLSFYKAPKVVIQEIIKIQRAFLWNGDEILRRIN